MGRGGTQGTVSMYRHGILGVILLQVCLLCALTRTAAAQNAAADGLASVANVRAVFDIVVGGPQNQLVSTQYVQCDQRRNGNSSSSSSGGSSSGSSRTSNTSLAFLTAVGAWCGGDRPLSESSVVAQTVYWSTVMPPGIFPRPASTVEDGVLLTTTTDVFYGCATFSCDMQDSLSTYENGQRTAPAAYGGLSPATPCCASTNSTFILFLSASPPVVVQTDVLPFEYMQQRSVAMLRDTVCDGSQGGPANASCTQGSSSCLLRLRNPRYASPTASISAWYGDGGVTFPVAATVCGNDISDVLASDSSAALLTSGYTAIVAAHRDADSVSFPRELIQYILSWIVATRGDLHGSTLRTSRGRCEWRTNASLATFYRTGEYVSCALDASMVGHLPALALRVDAGVTLVSASAAAQAEATTPCRFTIDLNRLVRRVGAAASSPLEEAASSADGASSSPSGPRGGTWRLELYSSGAYSALSTQSPLQFRQPYIVLGAAFMRGATLAITRAPAYASASGSGGGSGSLAVPNHLLGLPVLFLTAFHRSITAEDTANANASRPTAVCAARKSCETGKYFYSSLNVCANPNCAGIFAYELNPETMQCTLRPVMITLFAVFCFVLVLMDALLIGLRARAEKERQAHMRLINQVQRKKN